MQVSVLVGQFLTTAPCSPATLRQRRWALTDLLTFAGQHLGVGDPSARDALTPAVLERWLGHGEQSVAARRAKATTARGLLRFAADHHLLSVTADVNGVLRLPATPPVVRDKSGAERVLALARGSGPWAVRAPVWARFCAHTWLLAATGAPERQLAGLHSSALDAGCGAVQLSTGPPIMLPAEARRACARWLQVRQRLTAPLEGSEPVRLWVRTRPGHDRRRGTLAPAGLPISARGLRLAFTTTVSALTAYDPGVGEVTVADLRAWAQQRLGGGDSDQESHDRHDRRPADDPPPC